MNSTCEPATLATGTIWLTLIAADADAVFYLDLGEPDENTLRQARLMSATLDGRPPVVLATAQTSSLTHVSLDAENLYWMLSDGRGLLVPRAGGSARPLDLPSDLFEVHPAGGYLYFYRHGSNVEEPGLYRQQLQGGSPTLVDAGELSSLTSDGDDVFWILGGSLKTSKAAYGSVMTLARVDKADSLFVNMDQVYWTTYDSPVLWSVARAGGAVSEASPRVGNGAVADDDHVYSIESGTLMRASLSGGEREMLAIDDMAQGLALNDKYIFWANKLVPPTVKQLAKPP